MNVYHYNSNNSWQKEAMIAQMKMILKLTVESKSNKLKNTFLKKVREDDKTKDSWKSEKTDNKREDN